MNGAESLIHTLAACGVEVCFTNPGTTELHLLKAVGQVPAMRPVLGLFEGVCTGAADGYGRMTDKPAVTLLHLGPGLSNGLANLHNARRAFSPVINLVGDHALSHRSHDAPLASDIASLARPVSGWVHASLDAVSLASDGIAAYVASVGPPGRVATLIVPSDCAWNEGEGPLAPVSPPGLSPCSSEAVERAAEVLRSGKPSAILMTGRALRERGLRAAGRIAAATGAQVMCDTFNSRLERGAGRFAAKRLPYFPEGVEKALSGLSHLILVEASPPVSFFAYPGRSGALTPEGCETHRLASRGEDSCAALEALADALGAAKGAEGERERSKPELPTGPLNPASVGAAISVLLPENAVVSDESGTSGGPVYGLTAHAAPHDWLFLTGGAIGQGLPLATGAAIACPDRKVVCLQGDGGAMYTLQALWTQAREGLDVTTVVFSNRKYMILQVETVRLGLAEPDTKGAGMADLANPNLDFVRLAEGLGVHAVRADAAEDFARQFKEAMEEPGPHLIEAAIS